MMRMVPPGVISYGNPTGPHLQTLREKQIWKEAGTLRPQVLGFGREKGEE